VSYVNQRASEWVLLTWKVEISFPKTSENLETSKTDRNPTFKFVEFVPILWIDGRTQDRMGGKYVEENIPENELKNIEISVCHVTTDQKKGATQFEFWREPVTINVCSLKLQANFVQLVEAVL